MPETTFQVELWSPQPLPVRLDRINIDINRTALSYSTELPWGFNGAKVGYEAEWFVGEHLRRAAYLDRDTTFVWRGHVVIRANGGYAWEGRLSKPTYYGSKVRGFEGEGYGISASQDIVLEDEDVQPKSGGGLLFDALSSVGVYTFAGHPYLVDPGVQRKPADFVNHTPFELADIICKGGDGNTRFDITCYHNQQIRLLPRLAPVEPDYRIPYDDTVTWQPDYSQLYGTIVLTHILPTSTGQGGKQVTQRITNPLFAKTYNYTREKPITGGVLDVAGAQAFARTWLGWHSVPLYRAQIKRAGGIGLSSTRGQTERPWWAVRAGEWVKIGEHAPLIIVRTQVDAHAQTLTVECGEPFQTFDGRVAEYTRVTRAVERERSPVTGAFWAEFGVPGAAVPY